MDGAAEEPPRRGEDITLADIMPLWRVRELIRGIEREGQLARARYHHRMRELGEKSVPRRQATGSYMSRCKQMSKVWRGWLETEEELLRRERDGE